MSLLYSAIASDKRRGSLATCKAKALFPRTVFLTMGMSVRVFFFTMPSLLEVSLALITAALGVVLCKACLILALLVVAGTSADEAILVVGGVGNFMFFLLGPAIRPPDGWLWEQAAIETAPFSTAPSELLDDALTDEACASVLICSRLLFLSCASRISSGRDLPGSGWPFTSGLGAIREEVCVGGGLSCACGHRATRCDLQHRLRYAWPYH